MTDTSDAKPFGGYLFPDLPGDWFSAPTQLQALCVLLDPNIDAARIELETLDNAHVVTRAVGGDLDDLGALLGLPRYAGEDDDLYRVRLPQTVKTGISALSEPDMAAYLTKTLSLSGCTVSNGPPSSASFTVTIVGNTPLLSSVPALVRSAKAFGTVFVVYAIIPTTAVGGARVATFRTAGRRVGGDGNAFYVGS